MGLAGTQGGEEERQEVMGDLSEHFSRHELACPCCDYFRLDPLLLTSLEELRFIGGEHPITITSGYRCAKHNHEIGGAELSYHLFGKAADIRIEGMTLNQMYSLARRVGAFDQGGIGIYPAEKFIHVDTRGYLSRWARVNGQYVGLDAVGLA